MLDVDAELKDLTASVTSPSGVTEPCEVSEVRPGEYCIKFVPKELGVHTVSVKHRGFHIPGSQLNQLNTRHARISTRAAD